MIQEQIELPNVDDWLTWTFVFFNIDKFIPVLGEGVYRDFVSHEPEFELRENIKA